MSRWTVHLSPGEVLVAAAIAASRQCINRGAGTTNLQRSAQPNMTAELTGTYGELAVARLLNVYPDLTTHVRSGGGDCTYHALTIDVKATRNPTAELWVDARSGKTSDVYVLAVVDGTTVTAVGYATLAQMLDRYYDNTVRCYRIPQSALSPMDSLHALATTTY